MGKVTSEQKKVGLINNQPLSIVEDVRELEPRAKVNKSITVEEGIRFAFKMGTDQVVTPWHLATLTQLGNPSLSNLKLNSKLPPGTEINLGVLAYDLRQERAEKLLTHFQKQLLFKRRADFVSTTNAIEYLRGVLSEPKPELLTKTSVLESQVGAIFSSTERINQISSWLTDYQQNNGEVLRPAPSLDGESAATTKMLDSYIYSLSPAKRKEGVRHALNLAGRLVQVSGDPVFGAALSEWSIKRSQEWGIAAGDELKTRYLSQLKEKALSCYELARFEADLKNKSDPACHYNPRASREASLSELKRGYKLLGKDPPLAATTRYLLATAEIYSREGELQKEIEFRVKALKEIAGDKNKKNFVPGISPDTDEVRAITLASHAKVEFYNFIKSLPEERRLLVNETLSLLASALQRQAQDVGNNVKEKSLKQAAVILDLFAQTGEQTLTGKVDYLLLRATQENLNANPGAALKRLEEARNLSRDLVWAGDKSASSYLAAVAREECRLALEHKDKINLSSRISEIRSQIESVIPQNKALNAELTLFSVQALIETSKFEQAKDLLEKSRVQFNSISNLKPLVEALLREKSSSNFAAGLKTALGIAADASSIEWMMGCAAAGLVLGSLLLPGAGSAVGAKVGSTIGGVLAVVALGRVAANFARVSDSYQTGLTNVSDKDALLYASALTLDLVGAGKGVGITLRLTKLLAANNGAKLLVKSLFSRETEELTSSFLRGVLTEEVFKKAAAKGPEYLKLKAEEYFQRLFNTASKGALDTALDSSLGGVMMLNQGREIVGQLYELKTNNSLTPAQREEGLNDVGKQIAQMVAFIGAIKGISSSLDGLSKMRINSLKVSGDKFKSVEQNVSTPLSPEVNLTITPTYDPARMQQLREIRELEGFSRFGPRLAITYPKKFDGDSPTGAFRETPSKSSASARKQEANREGPVTAVLKKGLAIPREDENWSDLSADIVSDCFRLLESSFQSGERPEKFASQILALQSNSDIIVGLSFLKNAFIMLEVRNPNARGYLHSIASKVQQDASSPFVAFLAKELISMFSEVANESSDGGFLNNFGRQIEFQIQLGSTVNIKGTFRGAKFDKISDELAGEFDSSGKLLRVVELPKQSDKLQTGPYLDYVEQTTDLIAGRSIEVDREGKIWRRYRAGSPLQGRAEELLDQIEGYYESHITSSLGPDITDTDTKLMLLSSQQFVLQNNSIESSVIDPLINQVSGNNEGLKQLLMGIRSGELSFEKLKLLKEQDKQMLLIAAVDLADMYLKSAQDGRPTIRARVVSKFFDSHEFFPFSGEDRARQIENFARMHSITLRREIEQQLEISLSDLPTRSQFHLLRYLSVSNKADFERLKSVLREHPESSMNILYSFLAYAEGESFVEPIFKIAGEAPAEIVKVVFSKYREIAKEVDGLRELVGSVGDEANGALYQRILKTLLNRADSLLVDAANSKDYSGLLNRLERVRGDIFLLGAAYRPLLESGQLKAVEILGVEYVSKSAKELSSEEKKLMSEISRETVNGSYPETTARIVNKDFEQSLEDPSVTFHLMKVKGQIGSFLKTAATGVSEVYLGSFATDPNLQGLGLGFPLFRQVVERLGLQNEIVLNAYPGTPALERYIRDYNFVVVGKKDIGGEEPLVVAKRKRGKEQ